MPEKPNLDWKEYESITKYIYETLGKKSGVKIECYGNNCKVTGKSEVKHQVDVLTVHSDGMHEYKTAIECKYWKEKINKDIVMKVSEIIEDAGINKGVIVSKNGFTPDGISYAKYKNIGLVELREVTDSDWKQKGEIFDFKSQVRSPKIMNIRIDNNLGINQTGEVKIKNFRVQYKTGEVRPFSDLIQVFNNQLHKEEPFNVISKYYSLPGAFIINDDNGSKTSINGVEFKGQLTVRDIDLGFKQVDQVWLIMKLHFEDKSFTISEKGVIQESNNLK